MSTLVISYSRHDQLQVRAIVSVLKTALRDIENAVYWDGDFEPGDPWFEQIKEHIDAAQQLFVFWCWHSANSEQVRREFAYALDHQKRVVPVLLTRHSQRNLLLFMALTYAEPLFMYQTPAYSPT